MADGTRSSPIALHRDRVGGTRTVTDAFLTVNDRDGTTDPPRSPPRIAPRWRDSEKNPTCRVAGFFHNWSVPNPNDFYDIVSGRRRGLAATLARWGLRVAEVPYTWAVDYRNRRFDQGQASAHRVPVPVICVGNLTMGGTGKTPMVVWLAKHFRRRGVNVVIVSRGYGAHGTSANDEAREMARHLPDVPHVQLADRVEAAWIAVREHRAELIVLDDGFQHRRLQRDLDIVLIDALQPEGHGHVFPRGSLREPFAEIRRADVAILTRADMISAAERTSIWNRIHEYAPHILAAQASHAPVELVTADGKSRDLASLRKERVFAFCGLGNPDSFQRTLEQLGTQLVGFRIFPDHHAFAARDLQTLSKAAHEAVRHEWFAR